MAAGHLHKLHAILTRFSYCTSLRNGHTCLVSVRQKFSDSTLTGPKYKVEIGVTKDERTIVCYHPAPDIPYEFTQPIERPDPLTSPAETHEQVLKDHLSQESLRDTEGPTKEELSKMFFTTKHRYYPVGQYHTRRKNKNPPKDR